MRHAITCTATLLLMTSVTWGQAAFDDHDHAGCGSKLDAIDRDALLANELAGLYELDEDPISGGTVYTVPIVIHRMLRSDGTGGLPIEEIDEAIAGANLHWEEVGIQFCRIDPVIDTHNDVFFNMNGIDLQYTLFPTIQNNFVGNLEISCEGCGGAQAGGCYVANGSPSCDNVECCTFICEQDPFCCATNWDSICADAAIEQCVFDCGGAITGTCFESKDGPYCEIGSCCQTICAADPFCCDTRWDGICATAAEIACSYVVFPDDIPFLPVGDAVLDIVGGNLTIGNIDDQLDDGARTRLDDLGDIDVVDLNVIPFGPGSNPQLRMEVDLTDGGTAVSGGSVDLIPPPSPGPGFSVVGADFQYDDGIPYFHEVELRLNGNVVGGFITQENVIGDIGSIVAPMYSTDVNTPNQLTMRMAWDASATYTFGNDNFVVDEVIVRGPDPQAVFDGDLVGFVEPGGTGPRHIEEVRVLFADYAGVTITDGEVGTGGCLGDIDNDGFVNTNDLLAILGSWGPVAPGDPADMVPPGGDGFVNVEELLLILQAWGPCP